jgi:flagellar basal-body rod modification protein FlgD
MATAAGLLNHQMTAGQVLTPNSAKPMASATSGTSGTGSTSTSDDGATISANDFLTLLVTEMQNQDPTSDTDPNEYINQLVNVNSLEQLIDINQNLSTVLGTSTTSASSQATSQATAAAGSASSAASRQAGAAAAGLGGDSKTGAPSIIQPAARAGSALGAVQSAAATAYTASHSGAHGAKTAPGNLSVPEEKPAAHRVAHSLGARHHPK